MANRPAGVRMCVACKVAKPKNELVRVVRSIDGTVVMDETGRMAGRGAYICRAAACVKKAKQERRLERALRMKIENEIYEQIGEIHA